MRRSVWLCCGPHVLWAGSKGNYPVLAGLAKKLPLFPAVRNQRSMLYIDNLCEFLCLLILSGEGDVYFPQNAEYTNTAALVRSIADAAWHPVGLTGLLNPLVAMASCMPGRVGSLQDSIEQTEGGRQKDD